MRACDYRRHIRSHPQSSISPGESPPNKLFSRRSADESNGVFDFDNVVEDENVELCFAA